jgi:hypothetical protein
MSVIIGADNGTISGSGGLKITGDSSGIVQLTSGANTTTVTLNSNNSVTMGNTYINGTTVHNYNAGPTNTQLAVLQLNGANTKGGIGYSDFLQATNIAPGSNNTNKFFRIDNNGQLQIINSAYTNNIFNLTDGGQLTLANTLNFNASAGVNGINFNNNTSGVQTESTLNDYEVGTYTPTDQSGAGLTFTFARTSIYTKIGNLVNVQIDMTFPSTANSSTASISLPFTNINFYGGGVLIENGGYGSVLSSEVAASGSTFSILNTASNSGLTNANLSGKRLIFLITYRATF